MDWKGSVVLQKDTPRRLFLPGIFCAAAPRILKILEEEKRRGEKRMKLSKNEFSVYLCMDNDELSRIEPIDYYRLLPFHLPTYVLHIWSTICKVHSRSRNKWTSDNRFRSNARPFSKVSSSSWRDEVQLGGPFIER